MSGECPDLLLRLSDLTSLFHEHAGEDKKLSKAELKKLLQKDMTCQEDEEEMANQMMEQLDSDGDGLLDLNEFLELVNVFSCMFYSMS